MPGTFFKEYRAITTDWVAGAFIGATFDFIFNLVHSKSHILNVLSATIQLTCVTFVCHEVLYGIGERRGNNTLQNSWVLWFAVWSMSPHAVRKLTDAYYAFHRFLYGTRTLVPDLPEKPEELPPRPEISLPDLRPNKPPEAEPVY